MRFVILHHFGSAIQADHYDLLLQTAEGAGDDDRVLESYSTPADEFPDPVRPGTVRLKAIASHRRIYLKHEGPVSGGRGNVVRVEEGACALEASEDGLRRLSLAGRRLQGRYRLRRDGRDADALWIFERDTENSHG